MSTILGIDYERKHLGLAKSHGTLVLPWKTLSAATPELLLQELLKSLQGQAISKVVIGLPLEMSGKEGPMAAEVRLFGAKLAAASTLIIEFWDERLSSRQAEQGLREQGLNRKERSEREDAASAALMLQSFIDAKAVQSRA